MPHMPTPKTSLSWCTTLTNCEPKEILSSPSCLCWWVRHSNEKGLIQVVTIQDALSIIIWFVNHIHYQGNCSFYLPRDEGQCRLQSPKFTNCLDAQWFQISMSDGHLRKEETQHLQMLPCRVGTEAISFQKTSLQTGRATWYWQA